MFKVAVFLLGAIYCFPSFSKGFNPDERIDQVINLLVSNKPVEAFNTAFTGNDAIKNKKAELDAAMYTFTGLIQQIGAPYSCEKLLSRNLINRYRIDQYLCLSEVQPFIIQFDFYRPKNTWQVQGFSYTTNADDYIESDLPSEIAELSKSK